MSAGFSPGCCALASCACELAKAQRVFSANGAGQHSEPRPFRQWCAAYWSIGLPIVDSSPAEGILLAD